MVRFDLCCRKTDSDSLTDTEDADSDAPTNGEPKDVGSPSKDGGDKKSGEKESESAVVDKESGKDLGDEMVASIDSALSDSEPQQRFPRELVAFARRFREWNLSTNPDAFGQQGGGILTEDQLCRLEERAS